MKNNILLYLSFTILTLLAGLGFYEYSLLDKANNQAESFRHTLSRREYLLSRIDNSLGYNGAIHHFKNFILRGSPKSDRYYLTAQRKFLKGLEATDNLAYEFKEYSKYTPPMRKVLLSYLVNLDKAKALVEAGKKPQQIDKLVRVDDNPAIEAIKEIEEKFRLQKKIFRENHETNTQKLKKTFIISFSITTILLAILLFAYNQTLNSLITEKLKLAENKDNFVRKMAHEIRTPLNAMLGFQEFLNLEKMDPSDQENILHIKESSLYLLTLVNDILDFSKLGERKLKLNPKAVKESEVWKSLEMIGLGLKKNEQIFEVTTPENLSWISIDPIRLKQVFLNLISNSIKFTPENGKISLNVEHFEKNNKSFMRVSISDTGSGMTKNQLEHIFDAYYQIDGQIEGHKGTGLGLNITRIIVELMNGSIQVISEKGMGSTFIITLPRIVESDTHIKDHEESIKKTPLPISIDITAFSEVKMLVVEDTPINQKLMKKYFIKLGLPTPMMANDGLEALKIISEQKPDLIFMDLLMPKLGGIETTRRIRKDFSYNPVIIGLSANVESKEECLKIGMNDFLAKPLQKRSLEEALLKHMPTALRKSA